MKASASDAAGGTGVYATGAYNGVVAVGGNTAVYAQTGTANATAVFAASSGSNSYGVSASAQLVGVYGAGATGVGGSGGIGVQGTSSTAYGVEALSTGTAALHAKGGAGDGVAAFLEGTLQVAGASVGQVTLLANQSAVAVTSGAATTSSVIVLTPLANPGAPLWVSRSTGGFTIHRGGPPSVGSPSIPVAYLIVN